MKFIKTAGTAAALAFATTAYAAAPEVGATVFGPEGNEVGTVTAADAATVTIDTGKHQAPVPANVLADGPDGPVISITKVQLDQMMDQQKAQAEANRDAALVAGAMVHTAKDAMLGTVASVDGDDVVVTMEDGKVALKREHFAVNAAGTLVALFTAEQIEQAVAAAGAE